MAYFVWVSVFGKPSPMIVERWPYDTLNDGGRRDIARTLDGPHELTARQASAWQRGERGMLHELSVQYPAPMVAKESA